MMTHLAALNTLLCLVHVLQYVRQKRPPCATQQQHMSASIAPRVGKHTGLNEPVQFSDETKDGLAAVCIAWLSASCMLRTAGGV